MSFSVNTNIASLQAQNYLRASSQFQGKTINEVTSGLRIVNSGDDAAGLAIANSFRSDEAVLTQGIRNATDGISTLQTIDGGMNNISTLLDRARTLATQSASGTFTGDRSVLNDEFQNVLGEINRQAQSIGLDKGGQFAKALSVFVGGGRTNNGLSAIQNGSVGVDLSASTVDTQSLGLTGSPATNSNNYSLAPSSSTNVSTIVANNKGTATNPAADFYFSGPGFSTAGKIKVSVDVTGVTTADQLANAINTQIANQAKTGTSQATAFGNAGISAVVTTDASGNQKLAFTSSNAAFQVEAGNTMANAFMGNFDTTPNAASGKGAAGPASTDGSTVGSTVSAANNMTATAAATEEVTLRFQGSSLASPVDLNFTITNANTRQQVHDLLVTAIAANQDLVNAGISLTGVTTADAAASNGTKVASINNTASGTNLVFASSSGEAFSVSVTGDANNTLGMGSYLNTTATPTTTSTADSTSLTAAATYAAQANGLTSTLGISLNGGADQVLTVAANSNAVSTGTTNISAGVTVSTTALPVGGVAGQLSIKIDSNAKLDIAVGTGAVTKAALLSAINTALGTTGVAAMDSANHLSITSFSNGTTSKVQVLDGSGNSDANVLAALGLTAGTTTGVVTDATGDKKTGSVAGLNGGVANTADATGAGTFGKIAFTVDGATYTADLTSINTAGAGSILIAGASSGGILTAFNNTGAVTATFDGSNHLVLTSKVTGSTGAVAYSGAGSDATLAGLLGVAAMTDVAGTDASETSAIQQLNDGVRQNTTLNAANIQFSDSSGSIVISSTGNLAAGANATSFRVNAYGNGKLGFGNAGTAYTANTSSAIPITSADFSSGGVHQSSLLGFNAIQFGADKQTVTITAADTSGNNQTQTVGLNSTNARDIDEAVATINKQLQASNNTTLQHVVAFKVNNVVTNPDGSKTGTEEIQFADAAGPFSVTLSGNSHTAGIYKTVTDVNGLNPTSTQNIADSSTQSNGGTNADVATQTGAAAAVNVLAAATKALGNAQAVVGRGENQFNYAMNLAQSQVTNEAASESQIRDADLAQAAANLTKAQILVQAGTAALAQANSAPQAILSLLQR